MLRQSIPGRADSVCGGAGVCESEQDGSVL